MFQEHMAMVLKNFQDKNELEDISFHLQIWILLDKNTLEDKDQQVVLIQIGHNNTLQHIFGNLVQRIIHALWKKIQWDKEFHGLFHVDKTLQLNRGSPLNL